MALNRKNDIKQKYFEEDRIWISIREYDCELFGIYEIINYTGPAIIYEYNRDKSYCGRRVPYFVSIPLHILDERKGSVKVWVAPYVIKEVV